MRWNAVLVILAVLLVLDAVLIITRDLNFDRLNQEKMMRSAGVLRARKEAHSDRKGEAPMKESTPPSEEVTDDEEENGNEAEGKGDKDIDAEAEEDKVEEAEGEEEKVDENETGDQSGARKQHKVAGLNCDAYGGPSEKDAAEMVYWQDIPSDAKYVSPLKAAGPDVKYLTFEPDEGEWNEHHCFWTFPWLITFIDFRSV
jgi:hypothetical protein